MDHVENLKLSFSEEDKINNLTFAAVALSVNDSMGMYCYTLLFCFRSIDYYPFTVRLNLLEPSKQEKNLCLQEDRRTSDVKARARPGYRGLGPAFKSSGLRKGQAQALGRIYIKLGLGLGLGHGLALKNSDLKIIKLLSTSRLHFGIRLTNITTVITI